MATVCEATFDLLRRLGMTTVFGNPGSTGLPFLKDFPEDFRYVLGLQEATVLGMAEGFAQGTGRAALVNLHTGPGLGNAMGAMITAWHNKTPLVVTAGQQDRRHRSLEPLLTGKLVELAKPYAKGSFEPMRAGDVPGEIRRAYHTAMQQPRGPVFVSIPMDDCDEEADQLEDHDVVHRIAPDPDAIGRFASILREARRPALVTGAGVERSRAFHDAVTLAERLAAPVWQDPISRSPASPRTTRFSRGICPRPRSSSPNGSLTTMSSSSSAHPSSFTIPMYQARLSQARRRYSTSPKIPRRRPARRLGRALLGTWGLLSGNSRSYCQGGPHTPACPGAATRTGGRNADGRSRGSRAPGLERSR